VLWNSLPSELIFYNTVKTVFCEITVCLTCDEQQHLVCFCTLAPALLLVFIHALMISATVYGNEKRATLPAELLLFLLGLPFGTYELCTAITEHEIVIGDQYSL